MTMGGASGFSASWHVSSHVISVHLCPRREEDKLALFTSADFEAQTNCIVTNRDLINYVLIGR